MARDLVKVYPDGTQAVQGASFEIGAGEFVSIMGPSGSGKSTILHILGFLDHETSGEYLFNGRRYRDYTAKDRARVRNAEMGFVFQMFNLLPRATVYENVRLPLMYSDRKESSWDKIVRHYIHAVGLSDRLNYRALKLSGGEKQRVAIARALVNDPSLILADEPTGNLDSRSGRMIMDFLVRLHAAGKTVIVVTHNEAVAGFTRRVIEIRDGAVFRDHRK